MKREFTGVFIPAHIWTCKDITPAEKMLLAEISALSTRTGWCDASREHFAEWLQCDVTNISHYTAKLESLGFLTIKREKGYRSKMQVVSDRFYTDEVVNPAHGGSEPGSRGVVNPAHGGSEPGSPEIKGEIKGKIKEEKERAKRAAPEKEKPFYQLPINERLRLIEEHAAQKQNNAVIQFIRQSWFIEVWQEYLKHRKDYKAKPYKFPVTEYTAICELLTFSKGDHNAAKQVISQSVSKGWIGLFALKGNNTGNANSDNQQPKYTPVKAKRFGVNL